ncbi:hypothetical protein [Halorientalis litorea]|jgi:hypothetical protein|uniref:hypothetical protein n=1 Tax=Halorientalis litorea TaxID=2931977 RepID=UPI001FF28033|nr:hypothetical protein [Halorientalis litorea]
MFQNASVRVPRVPPGVDVKLLVPVLGLIAAEVWYLATQASAVIFPAFWMVPMAAVLLLYALDESLSLATVTAVLFSGRLLGLPYLFLAPMDNYLLFYGLFMAPVDVLILLYAFQTSDDSGERARTA